MDYLQLRDLFKEVAASVRPDIIHAGPIQPVGLLPALADAHPLLSMSWGFDMLQDAEKNLFWRWATKFVLNHSDWLAADCQTVKKKAVEFGFPTDRTTVFSWGVDLSHFNPDKRGFMRRQVGYEEDLLIVHTRSWEPRYGVDIALKGFWLALQEIPNLRLFMLGGGSLEKQVRRFVENKGIQERVLFTGYKKNQSLADYYQASDVYLSASHIDGSSVALMEAMACGCPPLVSDIPSNLEWVRDGCEGWVFSDTSAKELAANIIGIANDRLEVRRRGKLAREKAEADADWQKNFQRLLDTYETVYERFK